MPESIDEQINAITDIESKMADVKAELDALPKRRAELASSLTALRERRDERKAALREQLAGLVRLRAPRRATEAAAPPDGAEQ